jgi:hypothetical protein
MHPLKASDFIASVNRRNDKAAFSQSLNSAKTQIENGYIYQ